MYGGLREREEEEEREKAESNRGEDIHGAEDVRKLQATEAL